MNFRTVAALIALPLLAACAPEIQSTIYMQDVLKASADKSSLSVPAILRVPQSSEESCLAGLSRIIENLKTLAPAIGKGKCVSKDGDQLAEIETEMVIAAPDGSYDERNLFVLEVAAASTPGTYDLAFRLTRPLDEIVKVLAANSDELQADFDPAKFIFALNNDAEGTVELRPLHVFVDGEPHLPEGEPFALERRKSVEIIFSDVASEHVSDANTYRFATMSGPN